MNNRKSETVILILWSIKSQILVVLKMFICLLKWKQETLKTIILKEESFVSGWLGVKRVFCYLTLPGLIQVSLGKAACSCCHQCVNNCCINGLAASPLWSWWIWNSFLLYNLGILLHCCHFRSNININDVLGNYSLTLIDTLDTLLVSWVSVR